jgi:2-haloacid dehalogenase
MHTIKAVVFDLYGTLYDVHSVVQKCEEFYPGRGMEISALWRQKQLEYTWLRSLMGQYISFEQATQDAIVYTCNRLKLQLSVAVRAELCEAYLKISPYAEVPAALKALKKMELPLAILSNGSVFSIGRVVDHSGLRDYFTHLLSVEPVGLFKPHRRVYELACQAFSLRTDEILFVSSNAWDASGACHFGFQVCWINRNDNTFDELGAVPDAIINALDELPLRISRAKEENRQNP